MVTRSAGFTLIEVLVALLVTALGVFALIAANLNALKFNHAAGDRSHANVLAYDIADRMRANRLAALSGDYDLTLAATAPTGTTIADVDLQHWLASLDAQLPAGDGAIARNNDRFSITIQWDESRVSATRLADPNGAHVQTFVYVTEL